MPELPEVETIVWRLRKGSDNAASILGKTIGHAHLYWPKTLAFPTPELFKELLQNQPVVEITRRGKYIIIQLRDRFLLFHLRMSGDIRIEAKTDIEAPDTVQKHDRLALQFQDGDAFFFNDTRKFGRAWLVDDPEQVIMSLGPEPTAESLEDGQFYKRLQKYHRQIKPLLLDQTFMAGLGNIYTDEALFFAGIHPLTESSAISKEKAELLLYCIRDVIRAAIMRNGSSIDWVYKGGSFQNQFSVYHRQGLACQKCGTAIEHIVVGQRSAHFCPHCQPAPVKKSP